MSHRADASRSDSVQWALAARAGLRARGLDAAGPRGRHARGAAVDGLKKGRTSLNASVIAAAQGAPQNTIDCRRSSEELLHRAETVEHDPNATRYPDHCEDCDRRGKTAPSQREQRASRSSPPAPSRARRPCRDAPESQLRGARAPRGRAARLAAGRVRAHPLAALGTRRRTGHGAHSRVAQRWRSPATARSSAALVRKTLVGLQAGGARVHRGPRAPLRRADELLRDPLVQSRSPSSCSRPRSACSSTTARCASGSSRDRLRQRPAVTAVTTGHSSRARGRRCARPGRQPSDLSRPSLLLAAASGVMGALRHSINEAWDIEAAPAAAASARRWTSRSRSAARRSSRLSVSLTVTDRLSQHPRRRGRRWLAARGRCWTSPAMCCRCCSRSRPACCSSTACCR